MMIIYIRRGKVRGRKLKALISELLASGKTLKVRKL